MRPELIVSIEGAETCPPGIAALRIHREVHEGRRQWKSEEGEERKS